MKHKSKSHFLSVIVPIYKQEKTIADDLTTINHTLSQIRYNYEIVAVVDGINIDESFSIIKKLRIPKLKVYGLNQNHGKGYAVRYGIGKSKGDYVLSFDHHRARRIGGEGMWDHGCERHKEDAGDGRR